MNKQPLQFWSGPGGALLCNQEIPNVTQELLGETACYYKGTHFIGETIKWGAREAIAKALGGTYTKDKPEDMP